MDDEIAFKIQLNIEPKQIYNICDTILRGDSLEGEPPKELTKRQLLSQISTIFDPMGFVTPVTLSGKLLMRRVIEYTDENGNKLDWDDPLPKEFKEGCYKFSQNIFRLETIKLPNITVITACVVESGVSITCLNIISFLLVKLQKVLLCKRGKLTTNKIRCLLIFQSSY